MNASILTAMAAAMLLATWLGWRRNWTGLVIGAAVLGAGVASLYLNTGTGNAYLLMASILSVPALGGFVAGGVLGALLHRWFGQA